MRYRSLDTNLLVMLNILLETRSITQTGDIMGLTQPAVSSALGRLRQHFDDQLLVTTGRTNLLTPLGRRISGPLKDLLARTDALIAFRSGFDPLVDTRQFSVLASDYISSLFGTDLIRKVATAGPNLKVSFDMVRPDSLSLFEKGGIDLAIVPRYIAFPKCPSIKLFDDDFVAVVCAQNSKYTDKINEEQFRSERHVIYKAGQKPRSFVEDWLSREGISREVVIEVPSFSQLIELLPGTPFVATVQRRLVARMMKYVPVKILETSFEVPKLPILLQWHEYLDDDAGIDWFRKLTFECLSTTDAIMENGPITADAPYLAASNS